MEHPEDIPNKLAEILDTTLPDSIDESRFVVQSGQRPQMNTHIEGAWIKRCTHSAWAEPILRLKAATSSDGSAL
jgi:hypothetical protein